MANLCVENGGGFAPGVKFARVRAYNEAVQETGETRHTDFRPIMGWVAAAAVARIAFWIAMPRALDAADTIHYLAVAADFAAGHLFPSDPKIPLLYPLLSGLLSLTGLDVETSARLISLIASSLLIVPVYALARAMHGRRTAHAAAMIVTLWPWLLDYGSQAATEALGCTLWFTAVWLLALAVRRGSAWPVLAALSFLGLHLTRPEGTALWFAAIPAGMVIGVGTGRGWWKPLAVFALISAGLLALYAVYMHQITGIYALNYRVSDLASDVVVSNQMRDVSGTVILFLRCSMDTVFQVLPVMLGPVLLVFLGAGWFQPGKEKRDVRLEAYLLIMASVQWVAILPVMSPAPRYLMAPLIVLALESARGMVVVMDRASPLRGGKYLRKLPVVIVAGSLLLGTAVTLSGEHLGRRPREPREYKAAGCWMKEHLTPGLIFTRKPQVGYYAGMPTTGPALDDSMDSAINRARAAGARYVVIDERYTVNIVPPLRALLDPANAPTTLRLLHTVTPSYPEARVVIYELTQ